MTDDGILMRLALDEASAAADRGDPGFGAVVARAGQTVAEASSTEVTHRNPLAHDGLAVLREACRRLGKSDLSGCTFLWHRRTVSNVQRSTAADQDQPDRARC